MFDCALFYENGLIKICSFEHHGVLDEEKTIANEKSLAEYINKTFGNIYSIEKCNTTKLFKEPDGSFYELELHLCYTLKEKDGNAKKINALYLDYINKN